ncbi:MAG: hypothetical protein IJ106_12240 [Parasporobacterium sp.]|nr:hypothetical protein [Parasporobacterium sp.]
MKDVTKIVLGQSREFGRRPNLNYSRVDIDVLKVKRIFHLLKRNTLEIIVVAGDHLIVRADCSITRALRLTRLFGREFFLEIHYTRDGSGIILELTGAAPAIPERPEGEEQPFFRTLRQLTGDCRPA